MSTTADEEREDRDYTGQRDHTGDGDTWSSQPTEPCRRQMPPFPGSTASRGSCPGRIDERGVCDWCRRPKRVAS